MNLWLSSIEQNLLVELVQKASVEAKRSVAKDALDTNGMGAESSQLEARASMIERLLCQLGAAPQIPLIARIRGALVEPELSKRRKRSDHHNATAATFLRVSGWPCELDISSVGVHFDPLPGAVVRVRLTGAYESELQLQLDVPMVELPDLLARIPCPLSWRNLMALKFNSVMPGAHAPQVGP